ncbi:hypothetical protein CP533_0815 [Ophiocordyceps camponoti-saundersi (nom. inval.)]|nr:hypothetical protein CP533_0815 [Ophiocordyceps camponoti-saundersi (nom. inval.)]
MSLERIYVVRHGFRSNWLVDPVTGVYTSHIPSPTGIAADPALTSHGVSQADELASHLAKLSPRVEAVYSSPFYRCMQTIDAFVVQDDHQRHHEHDRGKRLKIRAEQGIGEWFGLAPFSHPRPAPTHLLAELFPRRVEESYVSVRVPEGRGESLAQLQERVASTVEAIIRRSDEEGVGAIVLCTHAAVVITLGRVLTGCLPDSVDETDFDAYTCGLTVFCRDHVDDDDDDDDQQVQLQQQQQQQQQQGHVSHAKISTSEIGAEAVGSLVVGGWHCLLDSDCSFLSGGQERGW